jgi:hypothetical protein
VRLFAWEASRIQNKLALPVRSTRAAHESAIAQKLLNFMGLSLVYTEFIVDIIRKNKRNYMDLPAGFALPPAIQMQRATRSGGACRGQHRCIDGPGTAQVSVGSAPRPVTAMTVDTTRCC